MKRIALTLALLLASASVSASPWTYHGTLNDGGKPANGQYDLRLTLINDAGTASVSQPITLFNVPVKDGNFSAEVEFGVDLSLAPALKLKTEVAQNGGGFSTLGEPTRFDPKAALAGMCWDTTGNVVAAGEFLGSTNNAPLEMRSNNAKIMRITGGLAGGAANIESGATANLVTTGNLGQTIAGGGASSMTCGPLGNASCRNTTTANYATIGGGLGIIASGNYSAVLGGNSNTASGPSSAVNGGFSNTASGATSVVGGGGANEALGSLSTISGGNSNMASGSLSTINGGQLNAASGGQSAVGGGALNLATGFASAVSGGSQNCAGGDYSWAGGFRAKIRPGNEPGDGTCVGNSGDANGDNGTFVWADDQLSLFISTGPRQFLVRAEGGMAINTNTPAAGAALTVNGDAEIRTTGSLGFGSQTRQMLNLFGPSTYGIGVQSSTLYSRSNFGFAWFQGGVHDDAANNAGGGTVRMTLDGAGQLRTTTGTIATVSDGRLKKNVSDYTGALSQIAALRPVYFEYRDSSQAFQAPGQHLGFIAQEVEKVFPQWVSQDEQGYLSLSLRGFEAVAVRAMQELEADNAALRASLAAQNVRLDALEKALGR